MQLRFLNCGIYLFTCIQTIYYTPTARIYTHIRIYSPGQPRQRPLLFLDVLLQPDRRRPCFLTTVDATLRKTPCQYHRPAQAHIKQTLCVSTS